MLCDNCILQNICNNEICSELHNRLKTLNFQQLIRPYTPHKSKCVFCNNLIFTELKNKYKNFGHLHNKGGISINNSLITRCSTCNITYVFEPFVCFILESDLYSGICLLYHMEYFYRFIAKKNAL